MLLDFNLSLNKPPSSDLSPSPSPNRRGPTCGPAGTPLYMPPEQLLALDPNNRSDHPCLIDERSDLYSLGVILYELLTGLHPSHPIPLGLPLPKLIPLMLAGQKKGIRPIRQLNPRVDKALAEAIERCLANDPRDRPHSATELLAVLRRQLSPFRRARRWAASHATLLCAAVLLGLATASAGIYFSVPKEPYSIRRLNQGLDRYRQGRFEEAILSLNQAIEADPASVEARFARARAFQQLDHIESALADFEKADDLANQQDGRIKACLGYCSNLLAIHDRAIENYQRARELNFVNAELCNNLGYSYLQWRSPLLKANDSVSRAQHCFDEAIKLDDGLQPAYYNRAILDIQKIAANPQKIPLQGLVDIRKAIELGPPSAPLFLDAARLCVLASKSDPTLLPESLGYLEKAIELGLSANNVKMDFLFAGLRSDPRFQTVLNKPPCSERFQSPQRLVDPVKE